MKYVLLIGDGMGDVPVEALEGKTPLEAAHTPTLDRLAPQSEMMLLQTVPAGYPPGSDVANLSLMGYAPDIYYTGRAPLEAASMGVELADDEYAFRCNLVNLEYHDDGGVTMIDYSAGHVSTAEARELILSVQDACGTADLTLHPGISYRHLLVYKDPNGDQGNFPEGFSTVPPHDHMDADVSDFMTRYDLLPPFAELLHCSANVLADHPVNLARQQAGKRPANGIWLWGEGKRPAMDLLTEQYGLRGSLISAVDLLMGIGTLSGLKIIEVEGATGYLDTNYAGKAQAALEALKEDDLVVVHIEAPDEAGHQGDVQAKIQAVEDYDQKIVQPIVEELEARQEDFRVVVTMDHYTPLHRRTHEDWPVPLFLYDSRGVDQPSGCLYSERNVLDQVRGTENTAGNGLDLGTGEAFFRRFIEAESGEKS